MIQPEFAKIILENQEHELCWNALLLRETRDTASNSKIKLQNTGGKLYRPSNALLD